jgi:4a-hydroxytetrahydrobiopterin dehydratase
MLCDRRRHNLIKIRQICRPDATYCNTQNQWINVQLEAKMEKKVPPLSDADVTAGLSKLPGWERDGDKIKKRYQFDSYLAGLAFASAVAVIAEGLDHHPDMLVSWRKVTVSYNSHSAGNKITQNDLDAAAAIEALPYKPAAG